MAAGWLASTAVGAAPGAAAGGGGAAFWARRKEAGHSDEAYVYSEGVSQRHPSERQGRG